MIEVGINSPQGEIMTDNVGRFRKLVGHVRDLSKSKGKETPPSTPRAQTIEQPRYMQLNLGAKVNIRPQNSANNPADAKSKAVASPRMASLAPQNEAPAPSMASSAPPDEAPAPSMAS